MNTPKVSILVPIFNVEKYLKACLDSIVSQTLQDIEIICIDDGSTDSSPKIIKKYASKDSRIVVITKKNSGYGDSMNKGLQKAKGEYIGIVESDDFVEPDMFESLYNIAKKLAVDVVKSNFFHHYTDLSSRSPQWDPEIGGIYDPITESVVKDHDILCKVVNEGQVGRVVNPTEEQHIFWQKPAIWSAIYKRSFLEKEKISFLPTPGASYQDTGFGFKVWATVKRAAFTDKAYLHYRQDNEASSVNNPGKVFCIADEYHEIESFLKKRRLTKKLGSLAQATKYGAYTWNYNRLKADLSSDFLELFSKEYNEANSADILDLSMFSANQRRDLKEIMTNPGSFAERKAVRAQAKISIIVPVYNVEKYLKKTLASLQKQTLKDIEIICVIDGATDGSLLVAEQFYKKDPRFVIIEKENGGPSTARNTGLRAASAKYVMFCDGDDEYKESMCEEMLDAQQKKDSDLVVAEIGVKYTDSSQVGAYKSSDDLYYSLKYSGNIKLDSEVLKGMDGSVCNKLFKLALIRRHSIWFPRGLWYEDMNFVLQYGLIAKRAHFLKGRRLYTYYRRGESIMSQTSNKTPKAIDHTRVAIRLFHFMKSEDILATNVDFF